MGKSGEKIMAFLQQKKWRKWKKDDWLILVLAGVLLLILAMPSGKEKSEKTETGSTQTEKETQEKAEDNYAEELGERLEKVLEKMDGVGEVKVMITLADYGEDVVEKDCTSTGSTTAETDSGGGSRSITQSEISNTTVYAEKDGESIPSLQKEITPTIEGVVIVAEGGDKPDVVSNISDAAMALFSVEAHKVKVVKMSMQEDSK